MKRILWLVALLFGVVTITTNADFAGGNDSDSSTVVVSDFDQEQDNITVNGSDFDVGHSEKTVNEEFKYIADTQNPGLQVPPLRVIPYKQEGSINQYCDLPIEVGWFIS